MARRKSTKTRGLDFDVTGVTIDDLIKMDFKELQKYNEASVKKITSRLVSAMNKRYRRLEASEQGQLSPTYQWFAQRKAKGKGFYSVKGKSKSTTISLFKQLQEKLQQQTSTIKGFKEYEKELYSRLGIKFKSNETDLKKKFWKLVHRYEEQATDENSNWLSGGGSPIVFEYIANNLSDWENMTIEQKNAKITQLYEEATGKKQQKKRSEIKTESDLFEDAYEDEGEF